jgi:hypothetical protein
MTEPQKITSRLPAPDTKEWFRYLREAQQQTPNRLEDAAKFLATMISVSLTIFVSIGKTTFEGNLPGVLQLALGLWLLSLLTAFLVLFPWRYRCVGESVQSIKQMHQRVVRTKRWLLVGSLALFFFALGLLVIVFFC